MTDELVAATAARIVDYRARYTKLVDEREAALQEALTLVEQREAELAEATGIREWFAGFPNGLRYRPVHRVLGVQKPSGEWLGFHEAVSALRGPTPPRSGPRRLNEPPPDFVTEQPAA